jgi:hypothetical protein
LQWRIHIDIKCREEHVQHICDSLNAHRCVILAKPVIEEVEQIKGAPAIIRSASSVVCEAIVLHQSEEEHLLRHLEKIRDTVESISHVSEKRQAIRGHIISTATFTSIILFTVVLSHELIIVWQNRPLASEDALIGAFAAAVIAFVVEAFIIAREHGVDLTMLLR